MYLAGRKIKQGISGRQTTGTLFCALLCLLLILANGRAAAGGGPETTLLVVNGDSPLSLRIANEYARLRDIPQNHLLWLHDVPSSGAISVKEFREKIWLPISEFIHTHRLEEEIDAIIYSADFPYRVDFGADLKASKRPKEKYIGGAASLTSLTYFGRRVALRDIGYLDKNHYFRDFARPRIKPVAILPSAPELDEKEVRSLRRKAAKALGEKAHDKAIGTCRKLLDSHPQMPSNWYCLARALAATGNLPEAMDALSKAVDTGWSDSLKTRHDEHLQPLSGDPLFEPLIERMESAFHPIMLPHGFRSGYVWSDAGLTAWHEEDFKDRYYLSTMLAYTGARGNSFPEVMNYLRSAAASDGTQPDGTVYLMDNNNVRAETRRPLFPTTLYELASRGHRGEVLSKRSEGQNGMVPVGKVDVIGVVVGSPSFDWERSNSRLLPGAIAESLTSYGGDFDNGSQTKLSEFLRHGAAGSSGAVAEPYSFQEKFPVPLMHSFYAAGCSLAEAFYQSVEYPYQLIIVGDPLARPFARFSEVGLEYPDPLEPWSGKVELKPWVRALEGSGIETVEFWLDGQRLASVPPGEAFELDTGKLADGTHRLRLVAVEESVIETRSYAGFWIRVKNGDSTFGIDKPRQKVSYGEEIEISGHADAGATIALFQGERSLGSTLPANGRWRITVPSEKLGLGPVSLLVKASLRDGSSYRGAPLELLVQEAERTAAYTDVPPVKEGLEAVIHDKQGVEYRTVIGKLQGAIRVPSKKRVKIDRASLNGYFRVAQPGFHQLVIKTQGKIRIEVNDLEVLNAQTGKKESEYFVPLSLSAGWHRIQIELSDSRRDRLNLLLVGEQPPAQLEGNNLGH